MPQALLQISVSGGDQAGLSRLPGGVQAAVRPPRWVGGTLEGRGALESKDETPSPAASCDTKF